MLCDCLLPLRVLDQKTYKHDECSQSLREADFLVGEFECESECANFDSAARRPLEFKVGGGVAGQLFVGDRRTQAAEHCMRALCHLHESGNALLGVVSCNNVIIRLRDEWMLNQHLEYVRVGLSERALLLAVLLLLRAVLVGQRIVECTTNTCVFAE